jgi:hypothetical protein
LKEEKLQKSVAMRTAVDCCGSEGEAAAEVWYKEKVLWIVSG